MDVAQVTGIEDLKEAVDEELWTVARRRGTPALRKAGNPETKAGGLDALHVTRVVTALFGSAFAPLGFEPVFARAFEEVSAGYAPVWARRSVGQIQLIRLRHREGVCRGGQDLEADVLRLAGEEFARSLE